MPHVVTPGKRISVPFASFAGFLGELCGRGLTSLGPSQSPNRKGRRVGVSSKARLGMECACSPLQSPKTVHRTSQVVSPDHLPSQMRKSLHNAAEARLWRVGKPHFMSYLRGVSFGIKTAMIDDQVREILR